MQKYVRKNTCTIVEGKLYKAVKPEVFADCKGCAFDDVCNKNSERINKNNIPYCSITDRRDMDDVIFKEVTEGEVFIDTHESQGEKLEKQIKALTEDFARLYDEADIDKTLRRFEYANKKRESAKVIKGKINELKNQLFSLK